MLISLIFIFAAILFLLMTLYYTNNKNSMQKVNNKDKSYNGNFKKNLNNLWEIDSVNNQVITINKCQHSIIVELESIEYNLMHDDEKINVDVGLTKISQMLKFPIQFLEIKEKVDMQDIIENIRVNTINSNDYIKHYAEEIIEHIERIEENEFLFERKNYMILSSFNERKIAEIELKEFYNELRNHLINIKIGTRLLDDVEITELIYRQFHKDSKNKIKDIYENGGLDLLIQAKNKKIKNM